MTNDQIVNCLIYPRPDQWGLRGDPILWTEIENKARLLPLPGTREEFRGLLQNLFFQCVGEKPIKGKATRVEKYDSFGMSGGVISSDFWLDQGFPLLMSRFDIFRKHWAGM
jgi:hypothetical protein